MVHGLLVDTLIMVEHSASGTICWKYITALVAADFILIIAMAVHIYSAFIRVAAWASIF